LNAPRRAPRRRLDGVLLLDKPMGLSSNQALQTVRRLYNAEKAGHTGTLDPLATGLLPLCFGEATKFSSALLDADKRYVATVQLGITTDTADAEGLVMARRPINVTREEIEQVLASFLGEIEQVPPMHSALKRDGKPLYEYARKGIVLERSPRRVRIYRMQLLEWMDDRFIFEVSCSKGTYVRTLAADSGERLGCGGHLAALRRTAIGAFDIAQAHPLTWLEGLDGQARDALLLPPDTLLGNLCVATLDAKDALRMRQGQAVRWVGQAGARMRAYDATHRFIGVCQLTDDGWLRPQRLVGHQPDEFDS